MQRFYKQLLFIISALVILTAGILIVIAAGDRGQDPIGYWKFDEGYGQTVYDSSGTNTAYLATSSTVTGCDPEWETEDLCKFGNCLYFDGDEHFVDTQSDVIGTGADSACLWMRPFSGGADPYPRLFDNGIFLVYINAGDRIAVTSNGGGTHLQTDIGTISYGTWQHVCITRNASGSGKIYINGKLLKSGSTGTPTAGTGNVYIGGNSTLTRGFYGFIDDVKIYNYERTAAQIKADYLHSSQGMGSSFRQSSLQEHQEQGEGLIGYWELDESSLNECGTNTDACDESGMNNNLAAQGNAAPTSTAKFFKAAEFDGVGDYYCSDPDDDASCEDDNDLDVGTSDITIEAWIKTSQDPAYLINKGADSGAGYAMYIATTTGYLTAKITDSSDSYEVSGGTDITDNTWHHVVFVVDKDDTGYIYLDGENDTGARTGTLSSVGSISNSASFEIGKYSAMYFNGQIDDVKLYKSARTASQVRGDYEKGPLALVHWKMDDKDSFIYDAMGNHDGTLNLNSNPSTSSAWHSGVYGSALKLDGTNDYVGFSFGHFGNLVSTSSYTVSLWAQTEAMVNRQVLMGDWSSGGANETFSIEFGGYEKANGQICANQNDGSHDYLCAGSSYHYATDTWYHIAVSWDKTTGNRKLYVNGVYKAGDTQTSLQNGTGHMALGRAGDLSSSYLQGLVDDIRIYNYARTQKQILEDMNAGHPAIGSPFGSYAGFWDFEKMYAITAYDSSINDNDGTLTEQEMWTTKGRIGNALIFDGSNDYVDVGDQSELDFTDSLSISAWIKTSQSSGSYPAIAGKGYLQAGVNGYGFFLNSDDSYDIAFQTRNSSTLSQVDGGDVNDGKWHFIVGVRDHSKNTSKIYVDGLLKDTDTTALSSGYSSAAYFGVGSRHSPSLGWQFPFNGTIDEVKVYGFALNESEIKQEYNLGKMAVLGSKSGRDSNTTSSFAQERDYCVPGDDSQCDPPKIHWKMEEREGQYVYDMGGDDDYNYGLLGGDSGAGSGDPAWRRSNECHDGACLNFDGTDDRATTPIIENGIAKNARSFSAWIKPSSLSDKGVACIANDSDYAYSTCYFAFILQDSTTVDEWQHVGAVWGSGGGRIYYNGRLLENTNSSGYVQTTASDDVTIGGNIGQVDTAGWYSGWIDDVRFYDYRRTSAQMAWDHNKGKPLAHWKMDEGQDTATTCNATVSTVYDYEGSNDGDLNLDSDPATSTAWIEGKFGCGLDFDGEDDYVGIGGGFGSLVSNSSYTVSLWVKTATTTKRQIIIGDWHSAGTNESFSIEFGGYEQPVGHITTNHNDGGHDYLDSGVSYAADTWYHVVVSWDKALTTRKIYINGVEKAQDTQTSLDNGTSISLGRGGAASSAYLFGALDDVRIYSYALNDYQIKQVYGAGPGVRFGPSSGLP